MDQRKTPQRGPVGFDRLLHPANAFAYPMAVVDDQDLTLTEKRALLAAWASDARDADPGAAGTVRYDDIMKALKELDRRSGDLKSIPRYRRILERRIPGMFGRKDLPGPALS